MPSKVDWKETSRVARQRVLAAIPDRWRLPDNYKKPEVNMQRVAQACGIMSSRQLKLTELTASELVIRIRCSETTAAEVTEAFCIRAAIAHQCVNCLTDFFPEEAIEAAQRLDEEFSHNGIPVGPLHGIPIAIKDTYDIQSKKTTVGCAAWYYNPPAAEDATLVRVMRDSGAILFARTTMPQTGMALETVSPLWGRTLNPYNTKFGSGGSSGGDGALVALYGAPCAPLSTDVGGSIRAPAAFNGLYGMRPSSERVPRMGLASTRLGMISIKSSCGPCCRTMDDLKLLTKIILTHPSVPHDPTCIPGFWNEVKPKSKLVIGVISTDGVVTPHPPVTRALEEAAAKLRAADHEVIEFQPDVDFWAAAQTTWALYFQTGAKEIHDALAESGEPPIPQFQYNLDVFNTRERTVAEVFQLHREQLAFKAAFAKAWDSTVQRTVSGKIMDCIICPSAPMAGSPHDFPLWWGYTSFWNLIDYPSIVLPVKGFVINPTKDPKLSQYRARENGYDRQNWEIYDPELWKTQPMTIQIVGRNCKDEDLIAATEGIDKAVNGSPSILS